MKAALPFFPCQRNEWNSLWIHVTHPFRSHAGAYLSWNISVRLLCKATALWAGIDSVHENNEGHNKDFGDLTNFLNFKARQGIKRHFCGNHAFKTPLKMVIHCNLLLQGTEIRSTRIVQQTKTEQAQMRSCSWLASDLISHQMISQSWT